MDPNQRLQVLQQTNPSLRLSVAPQAPQPQLQVAQPTSPRPNLFVGNQQIQQDPNAQVMDAPQPVGNAGDFIHGMAGGILSSAEKAAAATARGVADLRWATPNFIPGVRQYVDPALEKLGNLAASPFKFAQSGVDQINAQDPTAAGQIGQHIGNPIGGAAIYVPQALTGANDAVGLIKGIPRFFNDAKNIVTGKNTIFGALKDAVQGGNLSDIATAVANETKPANIAKALGIDHPTATYLAQQDNPDLIRNVLTEISSNGSSPSISPATFNPSNPQQSSVPVGEHPPGSPDPVLELASKAKELNDPTAFQKYVDGLSGEAKAAAESALNGKSVSEFYGLANPTTTALPAEDIAAIKAAGGTVPEPTPIPTEVPKPVLTDNTSTRGNAPSGALLDKNYVKPSETPVEPVPTNAADATVTPTNPVAQDVQQALTDSSVKPTPSGAQAVAGDGSTIDNLTADSLVPNADAATKKAVQEAIDNLKAPKPQNVGLNGATRESQAVVADASHTAPEVKAGLNTTDATHRDVQVIKQARELITKDINKAEETARQGGSDVSSVTAGELVNHYQAQGDYAKAIDVAQAWIKNSSETARALRANSLYNKLDPEGIIKYAAQVAEKNGNKLTPELAADLDNMAKAVQAMPDGEAKAIATGKLLDLVHSQNVSSIAKRTIATWKAGLLTAPTTTAGNLAGNTVESITKNAFVDPVAAGLDKILTLAGKGLQVAGIVSKDSTNVGLRTKSATSKGLLSGAKTGFQRGFGYLKNGYDPRHDPLTKYELNTVTHFGNSKGGKALQAYTDGVFRFLGAQDQPYYYANLNNTLNDLAITAAKNQGIKGAERDAFVKNFVANPTEEAASTAADAAARSVFGNKTTLGAIASGAKSGRGGSAIEGIIPFSGVPSSIASRILERSPVGAMTEIIGQIKSKTYDQRALVEALSNSAVGTTGAMILGKGLVDSGRITLGFPPDQKTRDLWASQGKQPYSIHLGDKWYSLNYIQPFGSSLAAGAAYQQSRNAGDSVTVAMEKAAAEAGKAVTSQSFLQGLSSALSALQDPTQKATKFFESTVGSVIPNFIRRTATATDPLQRQTNTAIDALKNGIPGLREQSLPKKDAFGGDVPRQSNWLDTMINPLKPSTDRTNNDPVIVEAQRLQDAGQGVMPGNINKSFYDKKTPLTPDQITELDSRIGPDVKQKWNEIITDPRYAQLTDEEKKGALSNAASDISHVYKIAYGINNGLIDPTDTKKVSLTSDQKDIVNGTGVDYLSKAISGSSKIPDGLTSPDAVSFYKQYNSLSKDDQKAFLISTTPSPEATPIAQAINAQRSAGLSEFKPSNALSKLYADYEADINQHSTGTDAYSPVDLRNKAKAFQEAATKLNYNSNTNDIFNEGGSNDLKTLMSENKIPKADLDSAIKMDNELFTSGLTNSLKFSKAFRSSLGYGTPTSPAGSGSGSSSGTIALPTFTTINKAPQFSAVERTNPGAPRVTFKAPAGVIPGESSRRVMVAPYRTKTITKLRNSVAK